MGVTERVDCEHVCVGGNHKDVSEEANQQLERMAPAIEQNREGLTENDDSHRNNHNNAMQVALFCQIRDIVKEVEIVL